MSEKMEKPKLGETMYNSGVAYFYEQFNNKSTARKMLRDRDQKLFLNLNFHVKLMFVI